jgi:predicted PurR-regulated permease PerM
MSAPYPDQRVARNVLIVALIALAVWTLRHFLVPLAWAAIMAIATWPLYRHWLARFTGPHADFWAALSFTVMVGLVLIVPLVYAVVITAREGLVVLHQYATQGPMQPPLWLERVPVIGHWLLAQWTAVITHDTASAQWLVQFQGKGLAWTAAIGQQLFKRSVILAFTLLISFFAFRYGARLATDARRVSRDVFGKDIEALLDPVTRTIRGTVNGVVLVALGEGALMSAAYAIAGVAHPVLFGVITGLFAMVPFAAPLAFGAVAIFLALKGSVAAAVGVASFGMALLFIVDHFLRPAIIGGSSRVPFLWILLGILGGVESFGLVGLFIGPALMAILCTLWRSARESAA